MDHREFIDTPTAERTAPAPAWPITPGARAAERRHWASEWARPVARIWEALGLEVQVALYVRTLVEAARPGAAATLRSECRRQAFELGLTPDGFNKLLAKSELAALLRPATAPAPLAATGTETTRRPKERFTVVPGGR